MILIYHPQTREIRQIHRDSLDLHKDWRVISKKQAKDLKIKATKRETVR